FFHCDAAIWGKWILQQADLVRQTPSMGHIGACTPLLKHINLRSKAIYMYRAPKEIRTSSNLI
ncbi:hypothetical protein LJC15_03810, partial [Desulfovibrio sp. OttesenSCG-928-G11]|nr:hypothetical protein [Desulfovibrio sp. OttesenSCG-928-G11]